MTPIICVESTFRSHLVRCIFGEEKKVIFALPKLTIWGVPKITPKKTQM